MKNKKLIINLSIFIILLIVVTIAAIFIPKMINNNSSTTKAIVKVDNKEVLEIDYSQYSDITYFDIAAHNIYTNKDDKVIIGAHKDLGIWIEETFCRDYICQDHTLSLDNPKAIICIPLNIIIELV